MAAESKHRALDRRTVLISPSAAGELKTELELYGARVLSWPKLDVGPLDNCAALDESIENLFGYDWLILRNIHAVDFFLRRFSALGHETSELDSLRVCAVEKEAVSKLESAQVHVDLIPDRLSSQAVIDVIESYAGGPGALRGLNILIPGASASRDFLPEALRDAGARVDFAATYRTSSANDPTLARIATLLTGGGIDCLAFTAPLAPRELAEVFDTSDLGRLVTGVAVACIDESTVQEAARFSLTGNISPLEFSLPALAQAIAANLSLSNAS